MNMLKKSLAVIGLSTFATIIFAGSIFASPIGVCMKRLGYTNIATEKSDNYPIKCVQVKIENEYITFYAKTAADCAQASSFASDPGMCDDVKEADDYFKRCFDEKYPEFSITADNEHVVKCPNFSYDGVIMYVYSKTSADCARLSVIAADPASSCSKTTTGTGSIQPTTPPKQNGKENVELAEEIDKTIHAGSINAILLVALVMGFILLTTVVIFIVWIVNIKSHAKEYKDILTEDPNNKDFKMEEQPTVWKDVQDPQNPQNPQQ